MTDRSVQDYRSVGRQSSADFGKTSLLPSPPPCQVMAQRRETTSYTDSGALLCAITTARRRVRVEAVLWINFKLRELHREADVLLADSVEHDLLAAAAHHPFEPMV